MLAPGHLGLNASNAYTAWMRCDDGFDQFKFFGQRGSWHRIRLLVVSLSRNVVQARHHYVALQASFVVPRFNIFGKDCTLWGGKNISIAYSV